MQIGVSNPNVPIFLPRVCTLVLFIISARSYSINFTFASSHVQAVGTVAGAGSVRKGIAAAAHDAKCEILYSLDEMFII